MVRAWYPYVDGRCMMVGARWVHGVPIFITSARGGARLVECGEREGGLVALGVAVDAAVHEHLVRARVRVRAVVRVRVRVRVGT